MAPEIKNRVFEPFFTTKKVGQGTGLGLSMVYGFAKQSGGHIVLVSEQGEGTTIKIYLPRVKASLEAAGVEDQAAPVAIEALSGHGRRVLVVEDDPEVLALAVQLLEELGYWPHAAGSGPEALERLADTPEIALLLTDAVLPGGINGRELAEAAAVHRPGIKVVYMSGYAEDAIDHHGSLGQDAVLLQKPFRKQELALKLHEIFARCSEALG